MNTNQFFYIDNGKQIGPVTMEELAGKITPDTDVWCDGMPDWAKASAVPELSALLGGVQPMSDANFTAQYGSANDYIGNSQNYGSNIQGNSQNYGNNQGYNNGYGNQCCGNQGYGHRYNHEQEQENYRYDNDTQTSADTEIDNIPQNND
jgi:hypothetical protein